MSNVDTRSILNKLFAKLDTDQKMLVSNWTRNNKGSSLVRWASEVDNEGDEFKSFLIEIGNALETEDWGYFDPEQNSASEGQAIETKPKHTETQAENENADEEHEEDEENEDPAPVYIESEGVHVEDHTPKQNGEQNSTDDPLNGFVDAITKRVAASMQTPEKDPSLTEERVAEIAKEVVRNEISQLIQHLADVYNKES